MILHSSEKRSQLFTVRVWEEDTGPGSTEWRGKIQRVVGGESLYFRDWQMMTIFLLQTLGIATEAISDKTDNSGVQTREEKR